MRFSCSQQVDNDAVANNILLTEANTPVLAICDTGAGRVPNSWTRPRPSRPEPPDGPMSPLPPVMRRAAPLTSTEKSAVPYSSGAIANSGGSMMISLSKACALAAACAVVLTACGGSAGSGASATPTASVDVGKASSVTPLDAATIARAKKQGSVLLYTNADAEQMAPITKAFEAKYAGIKLRVLNMNDSQSFQRYATETATGVRTADVVMATDSVGMLDFVSKDD